jgi:uncharacterized damage-inducible protein DinB
MASPITDLFRHNDWANLRLLDACAGLSEDDLAATAPGTYGAVRDTLVHLLASEARYVGEFSGAPPETRPEDVPFAGFDAIRTCATASGEALIEIAGRTQTSDILRGIYRGAPYEIPASVLLIQAINHATEHRAHIVTILNQRGVGTPGLDGIAYAAEATRGG